MAQLVASSLLSPFLTGHCSVLEILGSSDSLIWLAMDCQVLTIQRSTPDSQTALPTSIFLAGAEPLTPLTETEISLRGGRLALNDVPLQIRRWWRPPRAQVIHFATTFTPAFTPAPKIDRVLGLGRGLTPEGDDLLAGWLVAARSIGHPEFNEVRAQIVLKASTRTTTFSATLLEYAGEGYGIAPLIDYVNVCLQNSKRAKATRARLAQVGHTSGEALAVGVEIALGLLSNGIDSDKYPLLQGATA